MKQSTSENKQQSAAKTAKTEVEPVSWNEILPYFLAPCIFIVAVLSEVYFNNFLIMVWIPFVLLPIIDFLLPVDHSNIPEERVRLMEKDKRFLIPLYAIWVMDLLILYWNIYRITQGQIAQSAGQFLIYAFCCAQPGALNATVGHELLHRKSLVHKVFGTFSYGKLGYSHYFIQHVRGHHKNVATPGDNSTARADESVYQFYMRVVPCGYVEVWEYEQNRLKQLNGGSNSFVDSLLHNRLISFTLCEALYFGLIFLVFGGKGLAFHLLTNIIVLSQFEAVNYLEHYGLLRKMENGVYESVKITHSWNAPQLITNYLLFKLQRHSDHHANAYKPYQILDSFEESPMLPYGYSICLILCMIPPIWRRVIDPQLQSLQLGIKLTEEQKKDQKICILSTLVFSCVGITYFTFFM